MQGRDGKAMVSGCQLQFGSSGGEKGSGSGGQSWETFLAPRTLDIHHMVMKAEGDRPIG